MLEIVNLTQYFSNYSLEKYGVVEPKNKKDIVQLLNIEDLSLSEIKERAVLIANNARLDGYKAALIGDCSPILIPYIHKALKDNGIRVFYPMKKTSYIDICSITGPTYIENTVTFLVEADD